MTTFVCKSVDYWFVKRLTIKIKSTKVYSFVIVIKLNGNVLKIGESHEEVLGKTGADGIGNWLSDK